MVQDHAAFAALAEAHRRDLRVHCYRLVGALAEDLVQETELTDKSHVRAVHEPDIPDGLLWVGGSS
nr:hypothetical protein GCM10020063_029870 [Dactylosporangium thailandense]